MIAFQVSDMTSRRCAGAVTKAVKEVEHRAQRLGERFFRVIGSGEGGSGLGWSIIRRIAGAHHARIHVGLASRIGQTRDFPEL